MPTRQPALDSIYWDCFQVILGYVRLIVRADHFFLVSRWQVLHVTEKESWVTFSPEFWNTILEEKVRDMSREPFSNVDFMPLALIVTWNLIHRPYLWFSSEVSREDQEMSCKDC